VNNHSENKLNKVKHWKWLLNFCPYIRAIFIVGSVGGGYAKKQSDIDFLIIVKNGRIFTARAILTFITQIFYLRRNKNKITNRFCLNHYLTEDNLKLPYKSEYDKKMYTLGLQVLFDKNNLYQKFLFANNFNNQKINFQKLRKVKNRIIGDFFERILKKLQIRKIKNNIATKTGKGIIIANDKQLQFHPEAKSGINVREI